MPVTKWYSNGSRCQERGLVDADRYDPGRRMPVVDDGVP